jgi:putative membrane protein
MVNDPENKAASADDASTTPTAPAKKSPRIATLWADFTRFWKPETSTPTDKSATDLAAVRTDLASARTLMASDRTLMAWIRTSLSMISFGFTIYKILQGFEEAGTTLYKDSTPRNIGLFLSAMGTFAIIMGTLEYWYTLKKLRHLQPVRLARPSFAMALLMSAIGIFTFISITTRLL